MNNLQQPHLLLLKLLLFLEWGQLFYQHPVHHW
jgi:hypothetical protein